MAKIAKKEVWENDTMLDWFLSRHRENIRQDLMMASDGERVCDTFPGDRIMDFFDLLNSNVLICLLMKYGIDLVEIVAKAVNAQEFKLTAAQLKERLGKKPKRVKEGYNL
jgi:hypothetical protein